jgi:putative ABC transport system permease protein
MSVVTRGVKNAFRNWLRTLAVVLILAIGIGLSLSMVVANEAVTAKMNDLKAQVGTTLTINPAGARGMDGGGEPLTMADVETVSKVAHVASVAAVSSFALQNQDAQNGPNVMFKTPGGGQAGKTSLTSAIEPGTIGRRGAGETHMPDTFSLPIMGVGTQGSDHSGKAYTITAGRTITKSDTDYVAIVGKELAVKNNLSVGGTFTAYDKTFTVVGVYDQGNKFENGGLAIPLSVAQTLSGRANEIGHLVATVDSVDNLQSAQAAIKTALGNDKADVVANEQNVQTAIDSLKGVQQISIIAFVGALVAAAVIIFMVMLMIVRERKREIGVLKAIGGSNRTIVTQFIVEALVLVMMSTVVGLGVALVSSGSIANALVASNTAPTAEADHPRFQTSPGPRAIKLGEDAKGIEGAASLVGQVAANVGWTTVAYGLVAAVVIAIVGTALPAWLIAKVRPAEVMRGE